MILLFAAAAKSPGALATTSLILSIAGSVFGMAGIAGGAYAFFTVAKNKALLELYRGEADAQKTRAERLEKDTNEMKTRLAASEAAQSLLIDQVSGRRAVEDLRALLHDQHVEQMAVMTSLLTTLAEGFQPRQQPRRGGGTEHA